MTLTPGFKRPSVEAIRAFRGNFCGLALPYLTYGPDVPDVQGGKLLFTPGIVCETPETRKRAFRDYKEAGYTHLPLNLTNHTPVYHGIYPDWDDTSINQVLTEALQAGLIPGGAFMGDDDDSVLCKADPSLVMWGFPKWEQNGPDSDTPSINRHILQCREAYPNVRTYVHFTAGHAAGGSPEGDWWTWAWEQGISGILYQDELWHKSPQDIADRCADFLVRFGDPNHYTGWPKGPDFISYEMTAYPVFWAQGLTPTQADALNADLWRRLQSQVYPAQGYCNGGA